MTTLTDNQKNFVSDNTSPVDAVVLQALLDVNQLHNIPYGQDQHTIELEKTCSKLFDAPVKIFPVATGTGANCLSLSAFMQPWGSVIGDAVCHIDNDEGGAPENFTGGKIYTIPSRDGKMKPEKLREAILKNKAKGILAPPLQAVFLSQATEVGTIYTPQELKALTDVAHEYGLLVHLDGARLGNAVASLGCDVKDITSKAGVDAVVLGMTKAGAMAAEVVVVFESDRTKEALKALPHLRKRSGQTWSKARYMAAQALAMLKDNHWIKNCAHANKMAAMLLDGIKKANNSQIFVPYDNKGNEIFIIAPSDFLDKLSSQGFKFYRSPVDQSLQAEVKHITKAETARFVTCFMTEEVSIKGLIEAF